LVIRFANDGALGREGNADAHASNGCPDGRGGDRRRPAADRAREGAAGVITTKTDEYYPAATDTYIAWNIWDGKHAVVYAKQFGGSKWRVSPRGTDAWVGSIDGTTLTYQQAVFSKGRSDIYTYDLVAKTRHKIAIAREHVAVGV
jgi:hypothetical protein